VACAKRRGLDELLSEDVQHGRMYRAVEVTDPFAPAGAG
jgi:predicted nucleic acid-binding protein